MNRIIFDDERFSMTRPKTFFISMFVSWTNCFEMGGVLLCIL